MRKEDNDWSIGNATFIDQKKKYYRNVEINGEVYSMSDLSAGIAHAILLLVDAINDKKNL